MRKKVSETQSGKQKPRLYHEFASWWSLLSAPSDYEEEAEFYRKALVTATQVPLRTCLELGSGGGNNASHLKAHFEMTLVDVSPSMLEVSRDLNPECEHVEGDMRSVRLGRLFDCVFVHDAVSYITSVSDLRLTMETAYVHCKPGGAVLFAPDALRETFKPATEHGGHDDASRGLRYLEWWWDPDPSDTTYVADYAYMLRHENGSVTVEHDRHILGLFSRADWLRLLADVGFAASAIRFEHSEIPDCELEVFIGKKS